MVLLVDLVTAVGVLAGVVVTWRTRRDVRRVEQLTRALQRAGVAVPPRGSNQDQKG